MVSNVGGEWQAQVALNGGMVGILYIPVVLMF
jgi:hypothetical protein